MKMKLWLACVLSAVLACGCSREPESPVAKLQEQANQGDAKAQELLGQMYRHGRGVPQDHKLANAWYLKAAAQGNLDAQSDLGHSYAKGWGVEQDQKQAAAWFAKAAAQGHANAQTNLAARYELGNGVPKDDKMAVVLYEKAAAQGYAPALHNLGAMYANGFGVDLDRVEALKYWIIAEGKGDAFSRKHRPLLEQKMAAEEVAEARRRASAWTPSGPVTREVK
jgi:TPR repeat protein